MSALPPKPDVGTQLRNVRFVAKADITQRNKKPSIVWLVLTPHIGKGGIKEMSDEPSCCLWIKCFNEPDKFHCGRSTICVAVASGH
jgi:hypothetical protein